MDKRRMRVFRDRLMDRRESLVGQVQQAELYSRERDAEATRIRRPGGQRVQQELVSIRITIVNC